jgi:predicted amidohydrolase
MRIGYYQFEVKFGEIDANLSKVEDALSRAEADLIVLPEFFATGYLFTSRREVEQCAESYPEGTTVQALAKIAKDRRMTIVAGFPEKAKDKLYNSAAVITPDGPAMCYRKVHLYKEEKLYFAPGDTPFRVVDIGTAKIGVMICFDWFFPESARTLALNGAQIIAHPANLVMPYCPDSMPVRALENRVFTVTANRTGKDIRDGKEMYFIGQSEIVTPSAQILHRAPERQEELFITEIDPADALEKNLTEQNHIFRDRRPEFYRIA